MLLTDYNSLTGRMDVPSCSCKFLKCDLLVTKKSAMFSAHRQIQVLAFKVSEKFSGDPDRPKYMAPQACHNFFVKKPKIFENVKSERGSQFSEKQDSARVNHNYKNSQI